MIFKILIIILFSCVTALAQSSLSDSTEFNSETIEDGQFGILEPISPELVEETENDLASQIKEEEKELNSKDQNSASFTGSLSNSQKDQIKNALNGSDIEIAALIKTFSKILKRNYIIDGAVKGKVTIHLPTPLTTNEALKVFDTILLLKGFTTIPVTAGTWKVIKAGDAKQTTVPFVKSTTKNPSDQLVTEKVRLRHIAASEANELIGSFISKSGIIKAVESNNSLIIIDSQANISRLRELLTEIDVPAVDREITIIPVVHAEVGDISEKINDILGNQDDQTRTQNSNIVSNTNSALSRLRRLRQQNSRTSQNNNNNNNEKRSIPFKIIPDERTNSLIVVADKDMTVKVRELVNQLDSEVDQSSGRFWVYKLQHADAESLSEILSNLISGATSSGTNTTRTQGSSLTRNNAAQNRNTRTTNNNRAANAFRNAANRTNNNGSRVNFEGEVSITADPATNSLLINASKGDYSRIKDVIDELDIKRRQVLVEATILEVRIGDQDGFGVELQGTAGLEENGGIFGQSNFGSLTNLLTNPAGLTDITLAAASAGTLTLPGGITIPSQAILVSAVSQNTNVNVLSSPTILATDNEEAEIIVGENVPFVSSTATNQTNIGNTFNQVQRQDVGITLRITPQISSGEYVNLRIFVEISSVVEGTRADSNGPTTTIRTSETSVEVKDSQMVITGGLLQDQIEDSTSGFPILEDIPILGNLFQTQNHIKTKTNLLILITPKVIKDQYDARDHTKAYAGEIEKEIVEEDITPNRQEVLNSPAFDNVAEEYKKEIIKPGTILPALENITPKDKIELVVAPALPLDANSNEPVYSRQRLRGDLPSPVIQNTETQNLETQSTIILNPTTPINQIPQGDIPIQQDTSLETISRSNIPSLPPANIYSDIPLDAENETVNIVTSESKVVSTNDSYVDIENYNNVDTPIVDAPINTTTGTVNFSVLRDTTTGETIALSSQKIRLAVGKSFHNNDIEYICLGVYNSTETLNQTHPGVTIANFEQWDTNE